MKTRQLGQTLLEFALIAPVVFLLIGATVDLGRGVLIYTTLQGASREMARQGALSYYSGSNTLAPDCAALTTPCGLLPLTNGAHSLDPLGMSVTYLDSGTNAAPPAYGLYTANGTQPGTITLVAPSASTVYVFIYELDSAGSTTWACPGCSSVVRAPGHQLIVVDLKVQWKPVLTSLLGIPSAITFDSQSVERIEY